MIAFRQSSILSKKILIKIFKNIHGSIHYNIVNIVNEYEQPQIIILRPAV
jgi:hypothetical protein